MYYLVIKAFKEEIPIIIYDIGLHFGNNFKVNLEHEKYGWITAGPINYNQATNLINLCYCTPSVISYNIVEQ